MANNSVPGKLIGVRINGQWVDCQTDAKLNITVKTTDDTLCKPDGDALTPDNSIPWQTRTADSRDWNVTYSSQMLHDSLKGTNNGQNILKLLLDGNVYITDMEFATATGQTASAEDMIISGACIITSFTLNAPEAGAATFDNTLTGNGPLTYSFPPITT